MSPRTLLSASFPFVLLPHDAPYTPTATGPPTHLSVLLAHSPADDTLTLTLSDLSTRLLLLRNVLTATHYAPLRDSQSLLIDFAAFPNHLCDLFHHVSSAPDYVATLRLPPAAHPSGSPVNQQHGPHLDTAILRIIQTSHVKSITHIELSLRQASHEELVSAVAGRAREAQLAEDRARNLEKALNQARDQAQQESSRARETIQQFSEDVQRLEDKLRQFDQIESRATHLEAEVQRLNQALIHSKQDTCDARAGADTVAKVREEMEQLRRANESTQEEINRSRENFRCAVVERDEAHRECERIRAERDEATGEITRGNAIIERLQTEIHTARAKNKVKSTVISRQEQNVRQLEARIAELERNVRRSQDQVALLEVEKDGLNDRLKSLMHKLEENMAVLASDQQVIAYLNRELNERVAGDVGATIGSPMRERRRTSGRSGVPSTDIGLASGAT